MAAVIRCRAFGCPNKLLASDSEEAVPFFKYADHPEVALEWERRCGKPTPIPIENSFICARHFVVEDFADPPLCRQLKRNRLPTAYLPSANSIAIAAGKKSESAEIKKNKTAAQKAAGISKPSRTRARILRKRRMKQLLAHGNINEAQPAATPSAATSSAETPPADTQPTATP